MAYLAKVLVKDFSNRSVNVLFDAIDAAAACETTEDTQGVSFFASNLISHLAGHERRGWPWRPASDTGFTTRCLSSPIPLLHMLEGWADLTGCQVLLRQFRVLATTRIAVCRDIERRHYSVGSRRLTDSIDCAEPVIPRSVSFGYICTRPPKPGRDVRRWYGRVHIVRGVVVEIPWSCLSTVDVNGKPGCSMRSGRGIHHRRHEIGW